MIWNTKNHCSFDAISTAMLALLALLITGNMITAQDSPSEAGKYWVAGVVTDEESGRPVEGADVLFLVSSEQDAAKRIRKGTTDKYGRYRVELPLGHVRLWFPSLKPGFWLNSGDAMKDVITTPDAPIAQLNIAVKTAPVWNVKVIGKPKPAATPFASTWLIAVTEEPKAEIRAQVISGTPTRYTLGNPRRRSATSMTMATAH